MMMHGLADFKLYDDAWTCKL